MNQPSNHQLSTAFLRGSQPYPGISLITWLREVCKSVPPTIFESHHARRPPRIGSKRCNLSKQGAVFVHHQQNRTDYINFCDLTFALCVPQGRGPLSSTSSELDATGGCRAPCLQQHSKSPIRPSPSYSWTSSEPTMMSRGHRRRRWSWPATTMQRGDVLPSQKPAPRTGRDGGRISRSDSGTCR